MPHRTDCGSRLLFAERLLVRPGNDEFIMLLQGEATLEFEDRMVDMKAGDYLIIHKNCRHRIEKSSLDPVCVWLCVFDLE